MASALKLEVFAPPDDGATPLWMTPDQIEAARLAAFEDGYATGWHDCTDQRGSRESAALEALESSLQHLAFTHEEVRAQLMTGLQPVLSAMTAAVLPDMALKALPFIVAELITGQVGQTLDAPVTLLCHPDAEAMLRDTLSRLSLPPLTVRAEPALAAGQISLHWPEYHCRVDMPAMIHAIQHAVEQFFAQHDDAPSTGDLP